MTMPPLARSAVILLLAFLIAIAVVWSGMDKLWVQQMCHCVPAP